MKPNQVSNTITARTSHTSVTPRKANLILESIVGLNPQDAIDQLGLVTKRAAGPVIKLLKQSLGNAADQHQADPEQLTIHQAFATKGRVLKFVRFAGRGRVKPYQKVASHLTIILKVKGLSSDGSASRVTQRGSSEVEPVKETKSKIKNKK